MRPALVCLETYNPGMTTKGIDPKAAFNAGVGLPFYKAGSGGLPGDTQPGDDDERNRPQGDFSIIIAPAHSPAEAKPRPMVGGAHRTGEQISETKEIHRHKTAQLLQHKHVAPAPH